MHENEEFAADKDAKIAQLERELAVAKADASLTTARLLRELDELSAVKRGQISECLYHLRRINASGWWRLGKALERLIVDPYQVIIRLLSKKRAVGVQEPLGERAYQKWIEVYDTLSERDRGKIRNQISSLRHRPLISIVMPAYDTPEKVLREAIGSIRAQLYENWELCIADDASELSSVAAILEEFSALDARIKWIRRPSNGHIAEASNSALALAAGEFIALMDHDDLLAEQALYEVVAEFNLYPDADIIYSDEDRIDSNGVRHAPYFKTDWNPELFLSHNMVCHLGVYRRALVEKIGGFRRGFEGSQDYDLTLRAVNATSAEKIRHIPAILYHWRSGVEGSSFSETQLERCVKAACRAKKEYLLARKESAKVIPNPYAPGWHRICRAVPSPPPLVSLIVLTRDRHDLLSTCVDGLLNRTTYRPTEIIIVDHQSKDPRTRALLQRLSVDERVRILPYKGPFNYSDMNNRAVANAKGKIVGLLNNDIDVIEPEWLSEMVSLAIRPENGAIGAKLLYPGDGVQHGGVILGLPWGAEHVGKGAQRNDLGYFGRLAVTNNVSAVTGACMVLRKSLFEDVGGLNPDLAIAFNDVDLCLELHARGYQNVWTPFALLYHHESVSRGRDATQDKIVRAAREWDYLRMKWGHALEIDPYYNVNLSLQNPVFGLAFPPRRIKPWLSRVGNRLRES